METILEGCVDLYLDEFVGADEVTLKVVDLIKDNAKAESDCIGLTSADGQAPNNRYEGEISTFTVHIKTENFMFIDEMDVADTFKVALDRVDKSLSFESLFVTDFTSLKEHQHSSAFVEVHLCGKVTLATIEQISIELQDYLSMSRPRTFIQTKVCGNLLIKQTGEKVESF